MDSIYLEIREEPGSSDWVLVPLESAVCLFALQYLKMERRVSVVLIMNKNIPGNDSVKVSLSSILWHLSEELPPLATLCCLPVVLLGESTICVAGLCSVLRQLVKWSPADSGAHQLLGFRQGCLVASAESSLWTRFCEVDIVQTAKHMIKSAPFLDEVLLPKNITRFEIHMKQPVRVHNIGKKQGKKNEGQLNEKVEHLFAEGPDMTLADIMLIPCMHIIFQVLKNSCLQQYLPLAIQWYQLMLRQEDIRTALTLIEEIGSKISNNFLIKFVIPEITEHSLYKSDPRRYKPKSRIFTHQNEVEEALRVVAGIDVLPSMMKLPFGYEMQFDWECLPRMAQPEGGNLPQSRLLRKRQQLENLSKAVLKIAKPGFTIVDFCSGTGHLGIILAYMLPRCHIVLLENKEESLSRAQKRVSALGLLNVHLCQSNLDYFYGSFDIGVSLHACGVATDLVIRRCILQRASFVCCPCCYGGVQNNHILSYPRSKVFCESALTLHDYLVLGHCADQTHGVENAKTNQGHSCMCAIDSDRYLQAKEEGYFVSLSKLMPETCTPKNNLLVGIPLEQDISIDRALCSHV